MGVAVRIPQLVGQGVEEQVPPLHIPTASSATPSRQPHWRLILITHGHFMWCTPSAWCQTNAADHGLCTAIEWPAMQVHPVKSLTTLATWSTIWSNGTGEMDWGAWAPRCQALKPDAQRCPLLGWKRLAQRLPGHPGLRWPASGKRPQNEAWSQGTAVIGRLHRKGRRTHYVHAKQTPQPDLHGSFNRLPHNVAGKSRLETCTPVGPGGGGGGPEFQRRKRVHS